MVPIHQCSLEAQLVLASLGMHYLHTWTSPSDSGAIMCIIMEMAWLFVSYLRLIHSEVVASVPMSKQEKASPNRQPTLSKTLSHMLMSGWPKQIMRPRPDLRDWRNKLCILKE